MATLLLHACCGPCASYSVEHLRYEGYQVTALWYNPNIHPFQEHQRRLEAMQRLAQAIDLPLLIPQGYELIRYLRAIVGHEAERCRYCFRLRFAKTAEIARQNAFATFTTTLLISPHQKHELLRQVGEEVAAETGVSFLYQDLRPGFSQSRRLSKEHDLYRQQYCGCIYSEWERFGRADIAAEAKQCSPGD
jgi:hypothetical protein